MGDIERERQIQIKLGRQELDWLSKKRQDEEVSKSRQESRSISEGVTVSSSLGHGCIAMLYMKYPVGCGKNLHGCLRDKAGAGAQGLVQAWPWM